MNLLMFSLDQSLFKSRETALGDTLERFLKLAEYFNKFIVLVPTNDKNSKPTKIKNIAIIPCYGKGRIKFWTLYVMAKKLAKKDHFDWYVTNDAILGFTAYAIKKKHGGNLCVNVFGSEIYNHHWLNARLFNRILAKIARFVLKKADIIRTDTYKSAKLIEQNEKISKHKLWVIPVVLSAKNIEIFKNCSRDNNLRNQILGKSYKYLILTVSSFDRCKDISTLLKAMAEVVQLCQSVKLVFIGGKINDCQAVKNLVYSLNIEKNINFIGPVAYQDMPKYYGSADLFVLSSLHEGFPRVLMEAGLSKLPIVSTAVDGAYDLIEDNKTGFIVPVSDSKALSNAIIDLLKNPNKRRSFGQNICKDALKICDFNKILDSTLKMFRIKPVQNLSIKMKK